MSTSRSSSGAVSRRTVLLGAGAAGAAAIGGAGYAVLPDRFRHRLPWVEAYIPDAPEGQVRLETVRSSFRQRDVNLFTAVPAGHGDGAGLPVVVVLHGASATAADFQPFGLARFLTAAVDDGVPPFVLAGADGGVLRWEPDPSSADDPQRMLLDEMPQWLADRGFDSESRALWGWSMGGYGCLRAAEIEPAWARAVAAFSPALSVGEAVFTDADKLADVSVGLWCGTDDSLFPAVEAFAAELEPEPVIASYGEGGHTRHYWNDQTLDAFAFLSSELG
jgi:enterochelin esterase-like enzyme